MHIKVALACIAVLTIAATYGPFPRSVASEWKISGAGSRWSNWYQLCTPPVEANEEIVSYNYRLEGDRQCGSWAECRQDSWSPKRVCVGFRMQGHSESVFMTPWKSDDGARTSRAIIDYSVVQHFP